MGENRLKEEKEKGRRLERQMKTAVTAEPETHSVKSENTSLRNFVSSLHLQFYGLLSHRDKLQLATTAPTDVVHVHKPKTQVYMICRNICKAMLPFTLLLQWFEEYHFIKDAVDYWFIADCHFWKKKTQLFSKGIMRIFGGHYRAATNIVYHHHLWKSWIH